METPRPAANPAHGLATVGLPVVRPVVRGPSGRAGGSPSRSTCVSSSTRSVGASPSFREGSLSPSASTGDTRPSLDCSPRGFPRDEYRKRRPFGCVTYDCLLRYHRLSRAKCHPSRTGLRPRDGHAPAAWRFARGNLSLFTSRATHARHTFRRNVRGEGWPGPDSGLGADHLVSGRDRARAGRCHAFRAAPTPKMR